MRGPGFKSMNLSVFRSLPFGDKRVELRVETFNLFNWVNYDFPGIERLDAGELRQDHGERRRRRGKCSWR